MKTIFPFTLPFVWGVIEDSCGVELTELALIASTCRVVIVATTAIEKQIDKRKHAALMWIDLERISNMKNLLFGGPPQIHFTSRLAKTAAVLGGSNKRLDHLGLLKVAVELIQLRQPEVIACIVRIRRIVRIAAQITKVIHRY